MAQRRYAVCDGCGREQVRTAASPDRPSAGPFEFCSLACVKQFVDLQPDERLV